MDVTAFSLRLVFKSILLQNEESEECKAKLLLVPTWCYCTSTQEEEHFEIKEGIVDTYSANIRADFFLNAKGRIVTCI